MKFHIVKGVIIVLLFCPLSSTIASACFETNHYKYHPEERFTSNSVISPDGKLVYEYLGNRKEGTYSRKIYSIETNELHYSSDLKDWHIFAEFSPNSRYFHFGRDYADMRVYCMETKDEYQYYYKPAMHNVRMEPGQFSPGMEYIAHRIHGMEKPRVELCSLSEKKPVRYFEYPTFDDVTWDEHEFFFSQNGELILLALGKYGGLNKKFRIYNVESGEEILTHESNWGFQHIEIRPDNKFVAFSHRLEKIHREFEIEVFDIESGTKIKSLTGNEFAFNPCVEQIAVATKNRIEVYSLDTFELVWADVRKIEKEIIASLPGGPSELMFSSDGKMLLSTLDMGLLRIWDAQNGKILLDTLSSQALFTEDGEQVVYLGYTLEQAYNHKRCDSWTLNIWNRETSENKSLYVKENPENESTAPLIKLEVSLDGDKLSFTSGGLHVWSVSKGDFVYHTPEYPD